jgi:hypothetical protein
MGTVSRIAYGLLVTRPELGQLEFLCLDGSMSASAIYHSSRTLGATQSHSKRSNPDGGIL